MQFVVVLFFNALTLQFLSYSPRRIDLKLHHLPFTIYHYLLFTTAAPLSFLHSLFSHTSFSGRLSSPFLNLIGVIFLISFSYSFRFGLISSPFRIDSAIWKKCTAQLRPSLSLLPLSLLLAFSLVRNLFNLCSITPTYRH